MALLRLQRFMKLTMGKSLLPIANKRSRSWRRSFRRRAMGGMKKARIIGAQSSYGSVPRGEKSAVHLTPAPRSIVFPSAVPGHGNSDRISPFPDANVHLISIEKKGAENVLAEAEGSCSRVRKKRKISWLQEGEGKLKRMKVAVKEQRKEINQTQASVEGIELALAHGWAVNELMKEQNQREERLLMQMMVLCIGMLP